MAVFAVMTWYEKKCASLPVYTENKMSDFQLQNQEGKTISLKNWNDKIIVVDFFFTHCTSICPKMTKNLKKVQQSFVKDGDIQINSFSVDPGRDTVGRLKYYAGQFGIESNRWNLLTGDKIEIYRLARKNFAIVATDGDGGPNDFIHSDNMVLVDKKKMIRGYYNGTSETEINQLINDINKLKNEN
jgi:protein SCO1/2